MLDEELADGVPGGYTLPLVAAGSWLGGISSVAAESPIRPSSLEVSDFLPAYSLLPTAGVECR